VRLLSHLLLLIAVLVMPLGMTPASATSSHPAMIASMPMEHCPGQGSRHDDKRGIAECTMTCAAALPMMAAQVDDPFPVTGVHIPPAPSRRLNGLHPDTATPPPKLA
jgi:hypothetical protein